MNNKRALINNPYKKDIHRETAQHSFCYDTIFEGTKLGLKLVAPKGREAEICVRRISTKNEHSGTNREEQYVSGNWNHRRCHPPGSTRQRGDHPELLTTGHTTDCPIIRTLVDHLLAMIAT
jgi:hypothetical protein